MSDTVSSAPPASPLELMDSNPALFMKRDSKDPCIVTLPGSSNLDLQLFAVTAIGVAKPASPGTLTLTLYGRANNADGDAADPSTWLPLSSAPAEPIGGATDLPQAVFMIQGADLLVNTGTGKLQGTFKSNVASNPQPAVDLEQHPGDITAEDPLYIFAVGASFTPDAATDEGRRKPGKPRAGEDPEPICTLTLESLVLSA